MKACIFLFLEKNNMFRFFDWALKLNGFPMKEAKTEFNTIMALPVESRTDFVEKKKKEILKYHLQNNSYYKNFIGNKNIKNWEDIPIMTKKDFQKPLQERLSKGFTEKNIFKNKTSGSSGDPFIFAKDKYTHAITWASIIYRFNWYNIDFNKSYQARFYGIPLDFFGYTKERIKDFFSNRYRFSIFDLSDKVLENILQKFKKKKFDHINGYTSSIVLFSKFLQKKDLVLKDLCPTLTACFVTSEMLFDEDKILIEKQFGIPVINEYGASELDLIAFQNTNNGWQLNNETLFIEIVDKNNQILPFGQEGRIIITSLYNKAHPFIRYDIGDIGIIDEKSSPTKPLLKKLVGRTNDIAILPSGKKAPGLTFYYVTKSIIEDDGNVKEFIIKQTKINTFEIDYVSEKELTLEQINKINEAINLYLEPNLHFTYNRKNVLLRSNRGKLKQFQSQL